MYQVSTAACNLLTLEQHFSLIHPLFAAIFIAKDAVLTSFALGRQTSLVIDAGHEATVGTRRQICLREIWVVGSKGGRFYILVKSTTSQ